jgi:hypothetical protein
MKFKVLAAILVTITIASCIVLGGQKVRSNYLKDYNSKYIQDYLDTVVLNYDIVDVNEWITVYGMIDGSHRESVNTDQVDKSYSIKYTIHDKDIDYTYDILFSHEPNKKITVSNHYTKEYQLKLYNMYNDNYDIMKNIIEENGGQARLVSKYCGEESIDDYCIMMYVPSYEVACNIESELYKRVYGGYATDHIDDTNGVNIDLPRYIITNNIDEYNTWVKNLQSARDLFTNKQIESADSYLSKLDNTNEDNEYVYTPDIVNILNGNPIEYINKYNLSYTTLSESMEIEIPVQWIITNEHYEYDELGYAEYVYSVGTMLLD